MSNSQAGQVNFQNVLAKHVNRVSLQRGSQGGVELDREHVFRASGKQAGEGPSAGANLEHGSLA